MTPRVVTILALAATVALFDCASASEQWRGLRSFSKDGPWRAVEDANRIQAVFDNAKDTRKFMHTMDSARSHRIRDGPVAADDPAESLSASTAVFEKYARDFENGSGDEGLSATKDLEKRRQKLEMEGNFAAAEELNPFQEAVESPMDKLAVDALYAAGKWGTAAQRRQEAQKQAARAATMKAEAQEENDEFKLESGVYAFDNMVKHEGTRAPQPKMSAHPVWRSGRVHSENEYSEAFGLNSFAHAFDAFDEAKEEAKLEAQKKRERARQIAWMNAEDLAAEEAAQRVESIPDEKQEVSSVQDWNQEAQSVKKLKEAQEDSANPAARWEKKAEKEVEEFGQEMAAEKLKAVGWR